MYHQPPNFERVTNELMRGAEEALHSNWLFEQYMEECKTCWVLAHEDALTQAKYQAEHYKGGQ
jgi:hypothetical protein